MYKSHGITRDQKRLKNQKIGMVLRTTKLRINYRMSDISAALGLSQFNKLKMFLKKKKLFSKKLQ